MNAMEEMEEIAEIAKDAIRSGLSVSGICPKSEPCDESWCACFDAADDILEALEHANLEIGPGWRPIEEAPKDGTRVLVWQPDYWLEDRKVFEAWCYEDDEWTAYEIDGANQIDTPTLFRPLPAPPEESNDVG